MEVCVKMELNKVQIYHIMQIMNDRGTGHCKECRDILTELEEEYKKF